MHLPLILIATLLASLAMAQDTALQEALTAAGMKDPLRHDLQRPLDTHLARLSTRDFEKSDFFKGDIHVVHNPQEVQTLSDKLHPGDQLVLAGAEWKDVQLKFGGVGTETAPILIRAEKPEGLKITGTSEAAFHGEHLIITGLRFKGVTPAKNNSVFFRLGISNKQPAAHCIVYDVTMEDCGSPAAADWPRIKVWLINTMGSDNTIANCSFRNFHNIGQIIGACDLPPGRLQGLHILNNRFANRPYVDEQNDYEIIQIGWSAEKARSSGSLIARNVFENCDGESEIITLKASDVVVRSNRFFGCQGALVLREADRVLVQGNLFDGRGRPNTGGIRICGDGHVIIRNVFKDLAKPKDYYFRTISMMAASGETCADDIEGYGRARNVLIADNQFRGNQTLIAVGIYPRPQYPLLPKNIHVINNVFADTQAKSPFDFIAPDPGGDLAKELHETGNEFRR